MTRSRSTRLALLAACVVVAVAALIAPLATSAAGTRTPPKTPRTGAGVTRRARPEPTYRNPVISSDAPDPDIVVFGGQYYAFTTASLHGPIQLFVSSDLAHWRTAGWPGPLVQDARWTTYGREWAPGVIDVGGTWVLFYATEQTATGEQCITAATAPAINGPYVNDATAPLACNAIDPSPVRLPGGGLELVWKAGAADGRAAQLVEQPLAPGGLAFASGTAPIVLLSADQSWESTIENPDLVDIDGNWLLFFSGGDFESADYGTGLARCTGPEGPCTQPDDQPVLSSTSQVTGPGGASAFRDTSGQWWLAYAATSPRAEYNAFGSLVRSLRIDPVCVAGTDVRVLGPSVGPRPIEAPCD